MDSFVRLEEKSVLISNIDLYRSSMLQMYKAWCVSKRILPARGRRLWQDTYSSNWRNSSNIYEDNQNNHDSYILWDAGGAIPIFKIEWQLVHYINWVIETWLRLKIELLPWKNKSYLQYQLLSHSQFQMNMFPWWSRGVTLRFQQSQWEWNNHSHL